MGRGDDPELVSRSMQSTVGLLTAVVVFGVAIGGLYSLAYASVQGRLGALGARGTATLVALGGFLAVYLLPSLKYPANPPSIGNPDTIGRRTVLYLVLMLISLVVVVGGFVAAWRLRGRFGSWNSALLSAAGGLVVVAVAYAVLPGVHETPPGFPADVLWRFRMSSLAVQASVWVTLGLLFGALTERRLRRPPNGRDAARHGSGSPVSSPR